MIKDFECIKCGRCCKTIPMKKYHFSGIEKLDSDLFTDYDPPCPYFQNGKCSIYDDRPEACKDYPYNEAVALKWGCRGKW